LHPLLQQLLGLLDDQSAVMMDHGDINDRAYEDADGDLTSLGDTPSVLYQQSKVLPVQDNEEAEPRPDDEEAENEGPSEAALTLMGVGRGK
jgi:hypothetical protein